VVGGGGEGGRVLVLAGAGPADRITPAGETPGGDGGIESATRKAPGGALYLLAVNAGARERRATFRLPAGVKVGEVHVPLEGRKLPVHDGTFTDAFRPYDARIYATVAGLPQ